MSNSSARLSFAVSRFGFNVEPLVICFNCLLPVLMLTVHWDILNVVKLFILICKHFLTIQILGIPVIPDTDKVTATVELNKSLMLRIHQKQLKKSIKHFITLIWGYLQYANYIRWKESFGVEISSETDRKSSPPWQRGRGLPPSIPDFHFFFTENTFILVLPVSAVNGNLWVP